jgi:hypothetical protein
MSSRGRATVFVALAFLYAYFVHFWPSFLSDQESIRFYLVQAVVEEGTLAIDAPMARYGLQIVDHATFEGRSYLDKAPGLSFASVPLYWLLTRTFGMSTRPRELPWLLYPLRLLGVTLPALLGVWWVRRLVLERTRDERAAWTAALVLALATPYALYSTLFFAHATAAALGVGSFYLVTRARCGAAGALAGAMVLVDTATAPLALMLGVYAGLRERSLADLLRFGLCGAPFVAVQLAYNTWCFGAPLRFAYAYKANPHLSALHERGVYGFGLPSLEAIWGLTFGAKRGLFHHAPVLLLGLAGLRPTGVGAQRRDAWALLLIVACYSLWIFGFRDWTAGGAYGPRHLTPVVPFLAAATGLASARLGWTRQALPGLAVASFAATWIMIATFPYADVVLAAPLAQQGLPMLAAGHFSPSLGSWFGLPREWSWAPVVLVFGGMLALLRPSWRALALGLPGLALLGALVLLARPADDPLVTRSLARSEAMLGYPEAGRRICEAAGMRWVGRRWDCVPAGERGP